MFHAAKSRPEPFQFQAPPDWKVDFKDEDGIQTYGVSWRAETGFTVFIFSHAAVLDEITRTPGMLDSIAKGFETLGGIKMVGGYTKEKFTGAACTGEYIAFTIEGGIRMVMFIFENGNEMWQGQFTGSAERWNDALEILKTLKRKG